MFLALAEASLAHPSAGRTPDHSQLRENRLLRAWNLYRERQAEAWQGTSPRPGAGMGARAASCLQSTHVLCSINNGNDDDYYHYLETKVKEKSTLTSKQD